MNALTQIANYLKVKTAQIKRCEEWAKVYFVVIASKGGRFVSKSVVKPQQVEPKEIKMDIVNFNLKKAIKQMEDAAIAGGKTWEKLSKTLYSTPATIFIPVSELANPNIAGYVWAWKMQSKIRYASLAGNLKGLQLAVQGIEGVATVQTSLMEALIAANSVDEYRITVKVN